MTKTFSVLLIIPINKIKVFMMIGLSVLLDYILLSIFAQIFALLDWTHYQDETEIDDATIRIYQIIEAN